AVALELAGADAADAGQFVDAGGAPLRDLAQGGVVEDHVRGDVLLARQPRAQGAQRLEQRLVARVQRLRRWTRGGGAALAARRRQLAQADLLLAAQHRTAGPGQPQRAVALGI